MLHEVDIDAVIRTAGAAWVILVGLFTLILSLLALLLPFFVWRILHWNRISAQELTHLNTRMEHLLTSLAVGREDEHAEFTFTRSDELPEKREQPKVRERNLPRRARSTRRRALASGFFPRTPSR